MKISTYEEFKQKWPCVKVGIAIGVGWLDMLDEMLQAATDAGFDPERDQIIQIKEKFATIRVYINYAEADESDPKRVRRIEEALDSKDRSGRTCEVCGKPGQIYYDCVWQTRCEEHKTPDSLTITEYKAKQDAKGQ